MSTIKVNNIQNTSGQQIGGRVIQVAATKTTANTQTTTAAGFTAMSVSLTPRSSSNKILVMASLAGWSGDDSTAYLEYSIGGGAFQKNTELNGVGTYGGFGDHSWSHRSNQGPCVNSVQIEFSPNTTSQVTVRVRATSENGNNGGFYLNAAQMPTSPGGDYNSASAISSLVLFEIGA